MQYKDLMKGDRFTFVGDQTIYLKTFYYGAAIAISISDGNVVAVNEYLNNSEVVKLVL